MGKPVKIIDLARQMIRLAGYRAGEDIEIEIVGTRPGERLHEQLDDDAEFSSRRPGTRRSAGSPRRSRPTSTR